LNKDIRFIREFILNKGDKIMDIMGIMLFIIAVVFPIIALNKAHKLGEQVGELEKRIKELENKSE
jgi:hypothetical protein